MSLQIPKFLKRELPKFCHVPYCQLYPQIKTKIFHPDNFPHPQKYPRTETEPNIAILNTLKYPNCYHHIYSLTIALERIIRPEGILY